MPRRSPSAATCAGRPSDASDYDAILFVCGPFQRGELEERFLRHFDGAPLFGLNLSLPEGLDSWNPFDALWERDSSRTARPDLVFLSDAPSVPVVGVCKVEPYPGGLTDATDPAIDALVGGRHAAVVPIDTRLDVNEVGLRTPAGGGEPDRRGRTRS